LQAVRGFFIGMGLAVVLATTVLSLRPGGLRRQLRLAARRLRIFLVLGGVYVLGSLVIRLAFPEGPVADYGPPALALVLVAVFVIAAQDPAPTRPGT
jgi:hypothetical protein